jgi:hypothetical protein
MKNGRKDFRPLSFCVDVGLAFSNIVFFVAFSLPELFAPRQINNL